MSTSSKTEQAVSEPNHAGYTDGLLLIDKSEGLTSHDVVGRCRRMLSRKDVGHAGTLDPFATGLLVLLLGKATKLSDYILNGDKSYRATVLLGTETDTDDVTGEVIKKVENVSVSNEALAKAIAKLTGELELPVPIYSAIKVKGKKLYEKARRGEEFTPPMKKMTFRDLQLISFDGQRLVVEFACSKGSYVRAWAKALGRELGCGATTEALRRLKSEPYLIDNAVKIDVIEQGLSKAGVSSAFVPLNKCLPDWPALKIEGKDEKLILNGQLPRNLERFMELEFSGVPGLQGVKLVSKRQNQLLALIAFTAPMSFKIRRVFHH